MASEGAAFGPETDNQKYKGKSPRLPSQTQPTARSEMSMSYRPDPGAQAPIRPEPASGGLAPTSNRETPSRQAYDPPAATAAERMLIVTPDEGNKRA